MSRVLVIGSGFLGSNIAQEFNDHVVTQTNLTWIKENSRMLDITNEKNVNECFNEIKPNIVINCAGNTNMDFLEKNPHLAYSVNGEGPRNLAVAANKNGARLVHISTDGIFDGMCGKYTEDDKPNPINTYAKSKLIGEENVRKNCPNHIIIRTNFYGHHPQNKFLFDSILSKLRNREQIIGFDDIIFTPLEISNLSHMISELAASDHVGIFNLSSDEPITKYEFCCQVAKTFGFDEDMIKRGSIDDIGFTAKRPKNTSLINTKAKKIIKCEIMPLKESLLKIRNSL